MRAITAYRKGRNLHHYTKALVEFDRAEAAAENQRQRVYGLIFGTTDGDATADAMERAFKILRMTLFRRVYALRNVEHYRARVRNSG